jgi:hypothetical protein
MSSGTNGGTNGGNASTWIDPAVNSASASTQSIETVVASDKDTVCALFGKLLKNSLAVRKIPRK